MTIQVQPQHLAETATAAATSASDILSLVGSLDAEIAQTIAVLTDPKAAEALDNFRQRYRDNLAELVSRTQQLSESLAEAATSYQQAEGDATSTVQGEAS
ncbi:MAG: WXG100 family type VII secretion target [Candidatus Dormibacteria bacterium]